jgi:uridylate kinase
VLKLKKIVISLGGSLIYPENIDLIFLKKFKSIIEEYIKKDYSFIIICGGGKLARKFQEDASKISDITQEAKDWLGIEATKLNASLVRSLFNDNAYEKVIRDPTKKIDTEKKVIICSGWKPGWSTDYDAVLLAENIGASEVINMSNIDYVYDSDPKKNKTAKALKEISWKDFRKLVGNKWSPGLNMPFDPIAAKEAEKKNLKVIIIGKDLDNLKKVIEDKEFKGTTII